MMGNGPLNGGGGMGCNGAVEVVAAVVAAIGGSHVQRPKKGF